MSECNDCDCGKCLDLGTHDQSQCGCPLPDAKATGAYIELINEASKVYIKTMAADEELRPWTKGLPKFHAEGFKAAISFAFNAGKAEQREKDAEIAREMFKRSGGDGLLAVARAIEEGKSE